MHDMKNYSSDHLWFMYTNDQIDSSLLQSVKKLQRYKSFINKKKFNIVSLALGEGITGASITIDIFWGIVYLITLSSLAMSGIIAFLGLAAISLGISLTWKSYHKKEKEDQKVNEEMQLAICKKLILNELLARQKIKMITHAQDLLFKIMELAKIKNKENLLIKTFIKYNFDVNNQDDLLKFSKNKFLQHEFLNIITYRKKPTFVTDNDFDLLTLNKNNAAIITNKKAKIIKAAAVGITMASLLFASLFVCSNYLLIGLGLLTTAAMFTNPITIGIVLGFAALCGTFYAYQTYRRNLDYSLKKKTLENEHAEVKILKWTYDENQKCLSNLKTTTKLIGNQKTNYYEQNQTYLLFHKKEQNIAVSTHYENDHPSLKRKLRCSI